MIELSSPVDVASVRYVHLTIINFTFETIIIHDKNQYTRALAIASRHGKSRSRSGETFAIAGLRSTENMKVKDNNTKINNRRKQRLSYILPLNYHLFRIKNIS
jgi:hypothetical protein